MKKYIAIVILFSLNSLIFNCFGQEYKTALGVRLSTAGAVVNNSISLKQFISPTVAIEALLSISDPSALGVLIELHKPIGESSLKFFYGAGGHIGFDNRTKFGLQGIAGLEYKFQNVPLNLSLDWKPELNITSVFFLRAAVLGLSARFTF